jgi:hypothetical protein
VHRVAQALLLLLTAGGHPQVGMREGVVAPSSSSSSSSTKGADRWVWWSGCCAWCRVD